MAIGRLGNIINGDIVGLNTSNFGVEYTNNNNLLVPADQLGRAQHPVAMYDAIWELALFATLFYLWRRRILRPGQATGIYLVGFGASQLLLGAFRAAPTGPAGLKAAQLTALPIVAAGLWLFLRSARRGRTYAGHRGRTKAGAGGQEAGREEGSPARRRCKEAHHGRSEAAYRSEDPSGQEGSGQSRRLTPRPGPSHNPE